MEICTNLILISKMLDLTPTTHNLYNGNVKIFFDPAKKRGRYEIDGINELPMSVTEITGVLDKSFALMFWQRKLIKQFFENYVASVTQEEFSKADILALAEAAVSHPEKTKDEAKDTGNEVHKWLHEFAKAKMVGKGKKAPKLPKGEKEKKCLNGFLDWYNFNNVTFLESERVVYSRQHNYVGTLDAVAMVNDKLTLLDYKTSNKLYPAYALQIAGYQIAWNEEKRHTYDLKLVRKGKFSPSLIEHGLILHLDKEEGVFKPPVVINSFQELQQGFWHALELKRAEKAIKSNYKLNRDNPIKTL